MTRTTRVALAGALAALGGACSEPTTTALTQLNLDRPMDIAFACYGGLAVTESSNPDVPPGTVIQSAQPTFSCDQRSRVPDPDHPDASLAPPGQENAGETTWYGFILQSAPGTVAVAEWPTGPSTGFLSNSVFVLDADKLTPGKNAISVGEEPIAIATDRTGCFEVTANAGSCDLSRLDINSAVANAAINAQSDIPVQVSRLRVTNSVGKPILARPAAMIAEPSTTKVGPTCGPTPQGLVYIAYPSCNLVAVVDTATGQMVKGIELGGPGGPAITEGNEECPVECADGVTMGRSPDPLLPRPVALSFDAATSRLAIGADNSATLTVIDIDPMTFLPLPAVLQVALDNTNKKDLGITALALSSIFAMGGDSQGQLDERVDPGGKGQYVYAVTSDGTVRVVDVLAQRRECDTQIDGRFLRTVSDIPTLQCLPLDPRSRRVGVKGPGIEPIGDGAPLSVEFFTIPRVIDRPQNNSMPPIKLDDARGTLIGHFAIITATSGVSYIVNVDDDDAWDRFARTADRFDPDEPLGTQAPLVMAHQLRDAIRYRGATATPVANTDDRGANQPSCGDLGPGPEALFGGPRATSAPTRNFGALPPIAVNKVDELPILRSVLCKEPPAADGTPVVPDKVAVSEVRFSAPVEVRDAVFPDVRGVRLEQQWNITYEGTLSLDSGAVAVDGPIFRLGQAKVDAAGLHLSDPGHPFCDAGVEPFDIVQLRGCSPVNANLDCPSGYECFLHPESELGIGACMPTNEADRLANLCRDFLISGRRYTVGPDPGSSDLVLLPRKHELRTTPIDGCVDDNQCTLLANYGAQVRIDRDPVASPIVQPMVDPNDGKLKDVNGHQWSCQADPLRRPINTIDAARNKRCVQACTTNADCVVDDDELNRRFNIAQFKMVCQSGVCMEGITPPQQCINGPQRYDLHASEAFTVIGSQAGYVHRIVADAGGKCVTDQNANVLLRGRIPLKAEACDPMADPVTGKRPDGSFEPNPCSTTVDQFEPQLTLTPAPGACTVVPTGDVVPRQAPAIRFRNPSMTLTMVDPTYPGDSQCALDRQGQLGNIPLVYQGFQVSFHQINGFAPLTLSQIGPAFPIKVVRGPTQSIWILDAGDFLSTNIGQPSTRGRVFRLESTNLGILSVLQ